MKDSSEEYDISCEDITKEFYVIDDNLNWRIVFRNNESRLSSFTALNKVNLKVPKGKFVGILGRNGAGKSTLLRILAQVYEPTSGLVNTAGDVSSLFEMGGMGNRALTGYAYANRFLEIYGINTKQRKQLIQNICEFSELTTDFKKPLYSYSSGMLARLFFATATEIQHKIYLVDELLSVGDEHFQAKCWKRLRERFTNGASGILVTHDWSAVLKLCEFSCILEKGQIIASGNSDGIVQKYLDLPLPSKEYAEIIPNPNGYILQSGEHCELKFDVLLKKPTDIAINYSIELFRGGYGWDIMMMNDDYVPVACHLGLNSLSIKIKSLPLSAGDYYFNLFLKSMDNNIDSLLLDSRSWTFGNGIKIIVKGKSTNELVALPWIQEIKVADNANS